MMDETKIVELKGELWKFVGGEAPSWVRTVQLPTVLDKESAPKLILKPHMDMRLLGLINGDKRGVEITFFVEAPDVASVYSTVALFDVEIIPMLRLLAVPSHFKTRGFPGSIEVTEDVQRGRNVKAVKVTLPHLEEVVCVPPVLEKVCDAPPPEFDLVFTRVVTHTGRLRVQAATPEMAEALLTAETLERVETLLPGTTANQAGVVWDDKSGCESEIGYLYCERAGTNTDTQSP